jgi:hypothetical protein
VIHIPSLHPHATGHVLVPAAAIGGLSIVLTVGLEVFNVHKLTNASIAHFVSRGGAETFPKHLPGWSIWLAVLVFAFGFAFAILGTPGNWRRTALWVTSGIVVAAWAPVLSLASYSPDISAPWIATIWSGVCAVVYAARHRMPCDHPQPTDP